MTLIGRAKVEDVFLWLPVLDDSAAQRLGGWMWQTDHEHRFVHMSRSVEQLVGRPPNWHYGRTRQELGNMRLDDPCAAIWMAPLERREPFGPFDFVRVQDGQSIAIRALGCPIIDGLGKFRGYRGIGFRLPPMACDDQHHRDRPPRLHTGREADLYRPGSKDPIRCLVRDISDRGAGIMVDRAALLPDVLILSLENASFLCSVRWRSANAIGVQFIDA